MGATAPRWFILPRWARCLKN